MSEKKVHFDINLFSNFKLRNIFYNIFNIIKSKNEVTNNVIRHLSEIKYTYKYYN